MEERKKNLCAMIPESLHKKVREEQEEWGIKLNEYMERILKDHFEKGEREMANGTRTLAFQVSEEFFQRLKKYLKKTGQSQKEFVIGLIEDVLSQEEHLVSGEIAEDLTYYFAASEQIPTSVALGVLMNKDNTVRQAGGFIIQMMPYAEEETISKLEKKIAEFKSVTYALEHEHTPEKMMEDLLGDMDMKIYEKVPTQFHCNCSKERVEKAVISVGKKEIQNMIDDGEPIEVNCHFCNSHYNFSVEELEEMLKAAR